MAHPENNAENRCELATKVVSSWSEEEVRYYAASQFENDYRIAPDTFDETWEDYKDSFEWSEELRDSIKKDDAIEQWQIEDALYGRR